MPFMTSYDSFQQRVALVCKSIGGMEKCVSQNMVDCTISCNSLAPDVRIAGSGEGFLKSKFIEHKSTKGKSL